MNEETSGWRGSRRGWDAERGLECEHGWLSGVWRGRPAPDTHPARSGGAWRPPTRGPERGSTRLASVAGSAAGTRRAVRQPPPRSPRPLRPPPAGTRTRLGRGGTGGVGPRRAHAPRRPAPRPGLTFHRLRLRVVVGEPGPQAEAGTVGAGPDPGVGEGQRRPAGGAVQAGHGAPGGGGLDEGGRRVGPGRPTPPSCKPPGKPNTRPGTRSSRAHRAEPGAAAGPTGGEGREQGGWRDGHPSRLPGKPGRSTARSRAGSRGAEG